jgi:hypothetical protein
VLVVVFITKSADRHFDQSELSKSVELIALNLQHCRKTPRQRPLTKIKSAQKILPLKVNP